MAVNAEPRWLEVLKRMQKARAEKQGLVPEQSDQAKGRSAYTRKPPVPGRWETKPEWFCGAINRAGLPCRMLAIYDNGRCKWHGGCSTGPKTDAGKEQSRINGRKGGRPKKET